MLRRDAWASGWVHRMRAWRFTVFLMAKSKVTLPLSLPEHVVFCRSLNEPNGKLIELLLAAANRAATGREKTDAGRALPVLHAVWDIAFHAGEAVSQAVVGQFLAALLPDELVTVDPHFIAHRSCSRPCRMGRAVALTATGLIGQFLAQHASDTFRARAG